MKILCKPFKSPEINYISSYSTKTLGMRRARPRRAFYDPDMVNALVLYVPPFMTEQEKIRNPKYEFDNTVQSNMIF